MNTSPSLLYNQPIPDLPEKLAETIQAGCAETASEVFVFFRADDIGAPGKAFTRMVKLFKRAEIPLCLAVVPSWLTRTRYQTLREATGDTELFCWHQHGWLHKNHQLSGKKGEFGEHRSREHQRCDLLNGRQRCTELLREDFYPVFTPPWNRCSQITLELLRELGFSGISRSAGASPSTLTGLPDFQVNVDLHTRKEKNHGDSLAKLLTELHQALASGQAGIMLHHQRMNDNGFFFLEELLQTLKSAKQIRCVDFRRLAPK